MLSLDGRAYRLFSFVYFCFILNILFLASCIFLITIPPSIAALFAVARKYVRHESPPIFKTFTRAFVHNIKQSWIGVVGFIPLSAIIWDDLHNLNLKSATFTELDKVFFLIVLLFLVSTFVNMFVLMVHVEQTTRKLLLDAVKLNMVKPYLTLANLFSLCIWTVIATSFPVLLVILFFSVSSVMTYWISEQKFKSIVQIRG